jgi:serine/threonine protein kinase
MGKVYLAHRDGEPVAIKHLSVSLKPAEERGPLIAQFEKEARLLATLDHPALVHVYDFFGEGDDYYLVMTYVEGRTLDAIYKSDGMVEVETVLRWGDAICDVLSYLHEHEPTIIYRDLKPSNVMIDPQDRVWVLDFGIAKIVEGDNKTATLLKGAGTIGYAPLEQYGHGTTDRRSDIYALGATLYTLLTCVQPPLCVDLFLGDARLESPIRYNPRVGLELEAVLFKMMALRKDDRYDSVYEARTALGNIGRKIREARERIEAREAPGALKVRFVKPQPAGPAEKVTMPRRPPSVPPPVLPAGLEESSPRAAAPLPSRSPERVAAPAAPVEHRSAQPSWAPGTVPSLGPATSIELTRPWWQPPYSGWHLALGVALASIALAVPSLLGQPSIGYATPINSVTYGVGRALFPSPAGIIFELLIPIAAAWVCYGHMLFFPTVVAVFVLGQGLSDVGLGSPSSGPAAELLAFFGYAQKSWAPIFIVVVHRVGQLITVFSLVLMIRWLRDFRPTTRTALE